MKQAVRWMATVATVFVALMATAVQAQQPTVVISIRGIDPLVDDAAFLGEEVGQEDVKETAEQLIGAFTGGNGLAGIDRKKPLGMYWNATAGGPPEMPVLYVPVADEEALKELFSELAPDFKDTKGQWSATVNGAKLFGKMSAGYLFVSLAPTTLAKLADPARISNSKYDAALEVNIASIPAELKEMFLDQTEANGRQSLEQGPEPKNEAERIGREMGFNGTLAALTALINDGDKLVLGFDIDQKTRSGSADVSLTGKPNTGLAKVLAAYGQTQPAFAGIGSESAPLRMIVSHPTPFGSTQLEELFGGMKSTIDEAIEADDHLKSDADRAVAKSVASRLLEVFRSTAKAGSLHSCVVLEAAGGGKVRIVGGAKVANGDEAGKLMDDIIKLSKDNPEIGKVKLDAAKHGGARIHAVTPDQKEETKAYFGDEPAHVAFRADSLWVSIGGDNLNALKKALDAKPATSSPRTTTSPISLHIKPAALVTLMEKDDEGLLERAKGVVGKPGDKFNLDVVPIPSGAKLRIEFGVDLLKLADQDE